MKKIKRIICFLLIIPFIFVLSACKKDNNSSGGGNTETEQNGGNSGNKDDGKKDEKPDDNPEPEPEPEPYVAYTSSEIIMFGSKLVGGFFDNFTADLNDEDYFDDTIIERKTMFKNSATMLEKISEINSLRFGSIYSGTNLDAEDSLLPNSVKKFSVLFKDEDENGDSSVAIKIQFGYKDLDEKYDYKYYYYEINTNKKQGDISFDLIIENSSNIGTDNSEAIYYSFSFDGVIGETEKINNYNYYSAKRNTIISNTNMVNSNYISNFVEANYVDGQKEYISASENNVNLRDPNSEQVAKLSEMIGKVRDNLSSLILSGARPMSKLSQLLVPYVKD